MRTAAMILDPRGLLHKLNDFTLIMICTGTAVHANLVMCIV
jgi:hypothetical protein